MDFMSYGFEGSGVELAADTFTGSGRVVNERNLKSFSQIDQSDEGAAEFMEFGLGDMLQKSGVCDFAEMVLSHPVTVFGRNIPGDMEVEAWLPRDAISSHNWKTSEELTSYRDIKSGESFKARSVETEKKVKSGEHSKENLDLSSATVKRARITNFGSQPPICQVQGCFRDLTSSKDYYRRHRVCNEHSKTTKVIVDGIEQRFCQQCSRFHLLSEFDDDKRSCRKSLAGHNERRRKPQFDTHHGPRLFDMSLQTEPFFLPELLPVNYFCQERYELENSKMEEKHISFSKLVVPKSKGMQKPDPSKNHHLGKMVQELSTGENSSCGHSLLSAHSDWDFGKASGIRTLRCLTSNELCSGVIEMDGSSDVLDGNMGVYYEAEIDENFQSAESGTTIDLEQLSTHLQRVEHQRNSAQVKESNLFYCFTSG